MEFTDRRVKLEELQVQSQKQLQDFLDVEIQLGFTFAEFAVTERDLGNFEHFQSSKRNAEKAVSTIRHFLNRLADNQARVVVARRCDALERAVAEL